MAGLNGIAARLERLEDLAPPLPHDEEDAQFQRDWWQHAPEACRRYITDVEAEAMADPGFSEDTAADWYAKHHPAAADVVNGVPMAYMQGAESLLGVVQGLVVKTAQHALGWSLARERAAGQTAPVWDQAITELAAQRLLGVPAFEFINHWDSPEQLAALWRAAPMPDHETLLRAKLFEPELGLLAADDDAADAGDTLG